jgi:modulator of FtsH protease
MTVSFAQDWTNFFVAAAGAAAALAGLVIVAMSVNIQQILKYSHLPSRAAATIGTLILILVSCTAGLVPQSMVAFGWEIVGMGVCGWTLQLWSTRKSLFAGAQYHHPWHAYTFEVLTGQIQTLPFVIAGVLLVMQNPHGLYWLAGGVLSIFIFAVFNAWVLLVEILR